MHIDASDKERDGRSTSDRRAEAGARDRYPLRVLLVDDGAPRSKAFRRLTLGVQDGRYIVDRVTTQKDAFNAVEAGDHDVCVLSHLVGTRTGFELLSWIKARGTRVPIVFVAGSADHRTGVTAVSAGASCYVVEDTIESGLLEHSLNHAVEQTRSLMRLSDAGIAVDSDISTRTRLLFRIAEKLRDPSAALLEVARRSLDSALPAHALESFGLIEDKARILLTLANDINDLSMLEAGHLKFSSEGFSLRGLVSHMKQTVGSASRTRDPKMSVDIAPDVPDAVIGDPGRLRLVIISFVETVVARSSTDHTNVKVTVDERTPGAMMLRFTIQSVGAGPASEAVVGIPSAMGDVVGAPPSSFDSGALGMPVAHETVSRMGGSVSVIHDQRNAVSVQFTVRLQVSDSAREPRPNLDGRFSIDRPILVVAASAESRPSVMKSLTDAEIPFLISPSVEAWAAGRGESGDDGALPPLVVIESDGDTFAVCDEFNAVVSGAVPVVVVVASGKRGDAARCRERGIRGYLPRPLDSGDLVDVIRSSLALHAWGDTTTLVTRHWLREGRPSLRVLVVDDSSTNRFLLTRMLEQRGHSTAIACDGIDAVEASLRGTFDVILMDVTMPVMDGLKATRIILEAHSASETRPRIVGMSAFADQPNIDRSEDAGMDGFLAKPVRPDDLFAVIEHHVPATLTRVK